MTTYFRTDRFLRCALVMLFAGAPGLAGALPMPALPDCTDANQTEYYQTKPYSDDFVLTVARTDTRGDTVELLACTQGQMLGVDAGGAPYDQFVVYQVLDAMVLSSQAYTFNYMADVFRGQGLTATIAAMSTAPCVCGLR